MCDRGTEDNKIKKALKSIFLGFILNYIENVVLNSKGAKEYGKIISKTKENIKKHTKTRTEILCDNSSPI